MARDNRHNGGAGYRHACGTAVEANAVDGEAAGWLWRAWWKADSNALGATALRIFDSRTPFGAGSDMLAGSAIFIAICELEILVFLGGDLQIINRKALVKAGYNRILFRLFARRSCNAFALLHIR